MSEKIKYRVNDQGITEYSDDDDELSDDEVDYFNGTDDAFELRQSRQIECIEDLTYFHAGMTRNTCEALLLSNGVEGSFLIRKSGEDHGRYTVSVRCVNSIKHYSLGVDHFKQTYTFGMGRFDSLNELVDHFKCMPVLESESGTTVTLKHPYIYDIPEPTQYEKVTRHAELGKKTSFDNNTMAKPSLDLHIASKEGYLVKRGAIHKNWKKRWFVLQKNFLKYYKDKKDDAPIRTIDLIEAMHAVEDFCDGRKNCFRLALPNRIFYFVANSPLEAKSWIEMLQWKIEYYQDRKDNASTHVSNSLRTVGEVGEHAAYLGQYLK